MLTGSTLNVEVVKKLTASAVAREYEHLPGHIQKQILDLNL
jgi:hypothetical protein